MERTSEASSDRSNRVQLVDSLTDSPSIRAVKVWKKLDRTDLSDWDLICFSLEVIGMFVPNFPWLTIAVRHLGALIYNAHYRCTEEIGLCPKGSLPIEMSSVSDQKSSQNGHQDATQMKIDELLSSSGAESGQAN